MPAAVELAEMDPAAPYPTSEFQKMDYVPLYPTYSWIPVQGAAEYEVSVWKRGRTEPALLHMLYATDLTCYDTYGFATPGNYYWKVRALDAARQPISGWSENVPFEVKSPVVVAALGDSITHGGGAITTPPSYRIYDWETYCSVPVKNLGHSGDTTAAMLARFEHDVLPFAPRVLLIMGGVNDYRVGIDAAKSVDNLIALREKCAAHGITPVFLTPTPIRPALMTARMDITPPPEDWYEHQEYINDWVMQQEFHIEVARTLADAHSELEAEYTTDGLHPDLMGKKYIGERVDAYLREHFAFAAGAAERRVRMLKADGK